MNNFAELFIRRPVMTVLLSAAGPKGSYARSLLTPLARLLAQRLAAQAS